jgi:hypothetical protein
MLANRAMRAYVDGHYEAAQSLAVVVAERIITEHVVGGSSRGSYDKAVQIAEFDGSIMLAELRRAIAIAPIVRFYTEWYPWSGQPPPQQLSRHASVHRADLHQYSRPNSLLAVMLVVSLLREVTAWNRSSSGEA